MKTSCYRYALFGLAALALPACNRDQSCCDDSKTERISKPAAAATASIRTLQPWETLNEAFNGCTGSCGMRADGPAEGAVAQPNASVGDRTYCPVSGVVFEVKATSLRRELNGRSLFFCCAGCAAYFDAFRERVVAARGLTA